MTKILTPDSPNICPANFGIITAHTGKINQVETKHWEVYEVDSFGDRYAAYVHGQVRFFRLFKKDKNDKETWFFGSETEFTQAEWTAMTGSNPSHFLGNDMRPVEQVSYDDIIGCFKERKTRMRLPTEAEWEVMASFDDPEVPLALKAWHYEISDNTSHPVAMLAPNKAGLYDVLGNVWEWCAPEIIEFHK